MTLLDYPGKVACTLFTLGCNYRCPYCHNPGLVLPEQFTEPLSEESVFSFLEKRRGVLDGVCITGGEPLLHRRLPEVLARIRDMGFLIKLDTNGSFPDRLRAVVEAGLVDHVAMDVKNTPERYAETVGCSTTSVEAVFASVDYLLTDVVAYEFRTTVVRELHTEADLLALARRLQGAKAYYLQRFAMQGEILSGVWSAYSEEEMRALHRKVEQVLPVVKLRGISS